MLPKRPPKSFASSSLDLATIAAGQSFGRIYHQRYPEPLGYGKTPSRFSDPRPLVEERRFGVIYLGTSLKVCFVEAILRDHRNGRVGDYPIEEAELSKRKYAEIVVESSLRVVDLRADGPLRMGIPSDVVGANSHKMARAWSVAFHEHQSAPDGIIYPSRLNEEINLAIYERAISKIRLGRLSTLLEAPGFADVLNTLKVALT